ncbi:MAG: ABC transporter permease [Candidatus Rokuibacteriota bacterium]
MTLRVMIAFAAAQLRGYLREPLALGWTVFFPVLLLLILGTLDTSMPDRGTIDAETSGRERDRVFLLMGIVGMNVVSVGLFGLGLVLVQLRAIGFFRRLALTPQPAGLFIAGQVFATAVVVVTTTLMLLAAGGLVFGVRPPARPAQWSAFLVLGTGVFLGIGFALAATVRETRTAHMLGNLAFLALVFLGGVWYPVHVLPGTLQRISLMLPLPHLLQALRETALHGHDPVGLGHSASVLVGWLLATSLLALLRFRWNDTR